MEKVDFIKDSGCWWMVRRLTQWELRESMTNKICPRCDDKEEPKHDCKRKSWAILVVEEDDRDDEGVLIVFDSEKRRKEAEIENFGKKIVDLGDWKKKSKVYSETVDDANEIQLPEFTLSLGCSVPEMKMLNSGEGGAHEERRGGGRRVYNPTRPNKPFTQPKPNSLNQNPSLLNLAQYLTQFFINPSTNPIKIYDPGPNNPLPFTHPISNHLSTRPTPISYLKNHRLQTLTMSVDIPYDLIKQVQIAILKEANLSSFDPDDASVPDLPSSQSSLSEFDPSPLYLRCKHCKGRLLRGFVSLICVFCDKKEAQQETTPEPINFKSTFGCRWLPQSLALDGFEIAGAPVKANELNRGQTELEEFPILDFLDLEIQWQPELEKVESESDKSCLHLVGIPLDNFFTEGKKDIVSDQQKLEDQNDDSSVDHDFQVRDNHSSLENIKCFEPAVRSTEDKSGDDSFDGWEASFQSADDGNVHEESKLDNPVMETIVDLSAHMDAVFGSENIGSSATKPSDLFQDDLWSTSNSEEVGKSKQVDLTAATDDDGMVENVNNSSSMSVDLIQDALWKSESTNKEALDNKTVDVEDDLFDTWNDFTSSVSAQDPFNMQSGQTMQFEVTATVRDDKMVGNANNSTSIAWIQNDHWPISSNKITRLSEKPCREQMFSLKQKNVRDEDGEVQSQELTVYDYFVNHRSMDLRYSADIPCINVGEPKRPTYIPLKLCSLVSLQRYTKALNTLQRASLVEKSRQKPQERMNTLSNVLRNDKHDVEPMLRSCGISISNNFAKVEPTKIERWAVVNFSARCDIRSLVRDLIKRGDMKGLKEDLLEEQLEGVSEYKYSSHSDLELLNKWKGLPDCKWTWESCNNHQYLFPQSHLEDKVPLDGRGNVRINIYFSLRRRKNKEGRAIGNKQENWGFSTILTNQQQEKETHGISLEEEKKRLVEKRKKKGAGGKGRSRGENLSRGAGESQPLES